MNLHGKTELFEGYSRSKFYELVFDLFTGLEPARIKLSENLHRIALISPEDFALERHQELWNALRKKVLGKTRNIGLKRDPIERLTVKNQTISDALAIIWTIYEECCVTNEPPHL